jgi:hypothetical protein
MEFLLELILLFCLQMLKFLLESGQCFLKLFFRLPLYLLQLHLSAGGILFFDIGLQLVPELVLYLNG